MWKQWDYGKLCVVPLQAVPHILTVSDSKMLVLDPKSLVTKYNVDLGDITRISVSPLKDGVIVFHIRTVGFFESCLLCYTGQCGLLEKGNK